MKNKVSIIQFSIIILITSFLYFFSFENLFVWDDQTLILNNTKIQYFAQIPNLFFSDFFNSISVDGPSRGGYYRPLVLLSLAFDWQFWQYQVLGYHLSNLLLHLANTLLLYMLVIRILKNKIVAFLSALFFAIHPLQVDSVAYISGRTDLLATFFILSTLLLFLKIHTSEKKRKSFLLLACFSFLGALLSKELGLIVPILLFILSISILRESFKRYILYLSPFIGITLGYLFIRQTVLHLPPGELFANLAGFPWRFGSILISWMKTNLLILWPSPIFFERFQSLYTHLTWNMIGACSLFILYLLFLYLLWKKKSPLFFFLSLFGIALIPVFQIHPMFVQTYLFWSEHFYYLPLAGILPVLIYFAIKVIQSLKIPKPLPLFLIGFFLILFSSFTLQRISNWKNEQTLFESILKFNPNSARVQNNLGLVYNELGKEEEAITHLLKAVKLNPQGPGAYNNLGNIYKERKNFEKAIHYYEAAIQAGANTATVFRNLADTYIIQNNYKTAEKTYFAGILSAKNRYVLLNQLGLLYLKEGRPESALLAFQKVLEIKKDDIFALNNTGILLAKRGLYKKAKSYFSKALHINPDLAETYNNLGNLYLLWKKPDQAKINYEKALKINSNYSAPLLGLKKLSALQ